MLIAHLPAGYIATTAICNQLEKRKVINQLPLLVVGLLASILPDFDLAYYYTIDQQQSMHHYYITHLPFFWMMICLVFATGSIISRNRQWLIYIFTAFANLMLHCFLDTITGHMAWLYPFSHEYFSFFFLHSTYSRSSLNIITNWTFIFEIILIIWAVWLFFSRNQKNRCSEPQAITVKVEN